MTFEFSEGQKLRQKTTRRFLEDRAPLPVRRRVFESGSSWGPANGPHRLVQWRRPMRPCASGWWISVTPESRA